MTISCFFTTGAECLRSAVFSLTNKTRKKNPGKHNFSARIAAAAIFALAAVAILPANNAMAQIADSSYTFTDNTDAAFPVGGSATFNIQIDYDHRFEGRWLGVNVIMGDTTTLGEIDNDRTFQVETADFTISLADSVNSGKDCDPGAAETTTNHNCVFFLTKNVNDDGEGSFKVMLPSGNIRTPNGFRSGLFIAGNDEVTIPLVVTAKSGASLESIVFTSGDARQFGGTMSDSGVPVINGGLASGIAASVPPSTVTYTIVETTATLAATSSANIPMATGVERTFSVALENLPSAVSGTTVERVRLELLLEGGDFSSLANATGSTACPALPGACAWNTGGTGDYELAVDVGTGSAAPYRNIGTAGVAILDVPYGNLDNGTGTVNFTISTVDTPVQGHNIVVTLAEVGLRVDNDDDANLSYIIGPDATDDEITYTVGAAPDNTNARLDEDNPATIGGEEITITELAGNGTATVNGTVTILGSTDGNSRSATVSATTTNDDARFTTIRASRTSPGPEPVIATLSTPVVGSLTHEIENLFPGRYVVTIIVQSQDAAQNRTYDITLNVSGVGISRPNTDDLLESNTVGVDTNSFTISLAGIDTTDTVGVRMTLQFPAGMGAFSGNGQVWSNDLFELTFPAPIGTFGPDTNTDDIIDTDGIITFVANASTGTSDFDIGIRAVFGGGPSLRGSHTIRIVNPADLSGDRNVFRVNGANESQGTVIASPSEVAFNVVEGNNPAVEISVPSGEGILREANVSETAEFLIRLTNLSDSDSDVDIPYTIATGGLNATLTDDYTVALDAGATFRLTSTGALNTARATGGSIRVPASAINSGEADITMTVTVVDDTVREAGGRETVRLVLTAPTGLGRDPSDGAAEITIIDGGAGVSVTDHDFTDVCDRTAGVQTAIMTAIGGSPACETIVASDIEALGNGNANYGLAINDLGGTLALGDLDDLDEVKRLTIRDNALTGLPDNIFRDMGTLQRLRADDNNFTGEFNRAVFSSLGGSDANPGFSSLTRIDIGSNGDFADNALDDVLLGLERVTINGDDLKRYANFDGATSMVVPTEETTITIELRTVTNGDTDGDLPVAVMVPVTVDGDTEVTVSGTTTVTGGDIETAGGVVIPAGAERAVLTIAATPDANTDRTLTIGEPVVGIIDTAAATFTASTHVDGVSGAVTVRDNIVHASFVEEGTGQATVALEVGADTTLSALSLVSVPEVVPVVGFAPTFVDGSEGPAYTVTYPFGTDDVLVAVTANDAGADITSITGCQTNDCSSGAALGGSFGSPTPNTTNSGTATLTGLQTGVNTVEILLTAGDSGRTQLTYTITVTVAAALSGETLAVGTIVPAVESGAVGSIPLTLTRNGPADTAIRYRITAADAASNVHAIEGTDYTLGVTGTGVTHDPADVNLFGGGGVDAGTGTITVPATAFSAADPAGTAGSEVEFSITITTLPDNIVEGTETVALIFAPPGRIAPDANPVVNIADDGDDADVTLMLADSVGDTTSVAEGTPNLVAWVSHSAPVATAVTYTAELLAGTTGTSATLTGGDADVMLAGTIIVEAGETDSRSGTSSTLAVTIPANADDDDETFTLEVDDSNPVYGREGDNRDYNGNGSVFTFPPNEITIEASDDDSLSALSADGAITLVANDFTYDVVLEPADTTVNIAATPNDAGGVVTSIIGCQGISSDCTTGSPTALGGTPLTGNTNTGEQTVNFTGLQVGDNTVLVLVTAENGDTQTYTLTVPGVPNDDATLSDLETDDTDVPGFVSSDDTELTYSVSATGNAVKVDATPTDVSGGIVTSITGCQGTSTDCTTGSPTPLTGSPLTGNTNPGERTANFDNLASGTNTVLVLVTAADGSTETYILTVITGPPLIFGTAPTLVEGGGEETLTLTVGLTGNGIAEDNKPNDDLTLTYTLAGSAVLDTHYTLNVGGSAQNFVSGGEYTYVLTGANTTVDFDITPTNDDTDEVTNRDIIIRIINADYALPANAAFNGPQTLSETLTIADNDFTPTFATTGANAAEPTTASADRRLDLDDAPTAGVATVTFAVDSASTATRDADYDIRFTPVGRAEQILLDGDNDFTLPDGVRMGDLVVRAMDDDVIDANETVIINITAISIASDANAASAVDLSASPALLSSTFTIDDNEVGVELTRSAATINEAPPGTGRFTIVISDAAVSSIARVSYTLGISGGTGTNLDDDIASAVFTGTTETPTLTGGTFTGEFDVNINASGDAATVTLAIIPTDDAGVNNETITFTITGVTDTTNNIAIQSAISGDDVSNGEISIDIIDADTPANICNRTDDVEAAILAQIAATNDCNATNSRQLAAITELDLQNFSIAVGDLAGLNGLTTLDLSDVLANGIADGALAPVLDTLTSLTLPVDNRLRSEVSVVDSGTDGSIPRGGSGSFVVTRTNDHTAIDVPYTLAYTDGTNSIDTGPFTVTGDTTEGATKEGGTLKFAAGEDRKILTIAATSGVNLAGEVEITLDTPTLPDDPRTPSPLVATLIEVPAATNNRQLNVVLPVARPTLSSTAGSIGEKAGDDFVVTLNLGTGGDSAYGTAAVSFTLSNTSGDETADPGVPTLATSAGPPVVPEDGDYTLAVSPAQTGNLGNSNTVNLTAGVSSVSFTFTAIDDDRREGNEVVTLTVTGVIFGSATNFPGSLAADIEITEVSGEDVMRETQMITHIVGKEQVNLVTGLVRQRVSALTLGSPQGFSDPGVQLALAENPETLQDFFSQMALESSGEMDDGGTYAIWAKGQYINLSGSPDVVGQDNFEYDGKIAGIGVGMEKRFSESLVGLSMNFSSADIDSKSDMRADANYRETMTFFAPYAAWKPNNSRLTLWGTAGAGFGSAEITGGEDHGEGNPSVQAFFAQGGVDISDNIGETAEVVFGMSAVVIEKSIDAWNAGALNVPGTESSVFQAQADFTAYFPVYADDGQVLRPYVGLASVHDIGDVTDDDRHAMELQTGVAWSNGPWQVSFDTFYQFLRDDQEAWGIFGEAQWSGRGDLDGLFMGVTSGHGTASSMSDAASSTDSVNSDIDTNLADAETETAEWSIQTTTEYGFAAPLMHRNGRATPFFRSTHSADAQSFESGVRMGVTDNIGLTVETNRHMPADDDPYSEHAVGLEARWAF